MKNQGRKVSRVSSVPGVLLRGSSISRTTKKIKLLILLIPLVLLVLFAASADAATGIHKQINFQGKLVNSNGTNVADNTYSVVFTLYDAASGGTNLWDETQSVTTNDGIFQVSLGSVDTTLGNVNFNQDNLYLGIKVGADSEMTPRVRFSAVPYAFNAETVGGIAGTENATGFSLSGGTSSQKTLTVTDDITLGNDALDFAQFADSQTLDANTTVSLSTLNYIFDLTSTGEFFIRDAGNNFVQFLADGTITLGKAASGGSINLGIGSGADTINIGTDNTVADILAIGNSNTGTTLALTGGDDWSISAAGAAVLGSIAGAGLSDCDAANDKLQWNTSTGQFVCGTDLGANLQTIGLNDTTTENLTGTNTVILDNGGNTYLGITPADTSSNILINVTIRVDSDNTDSEVDAFEVRRTTDGSNPSCSSTLIGSAMEIETTNIDDDAWVAGNFVDSPSTTNQVRYTVCGMATGGTASNDTNQITLTLSEIGSGSGGGGGGNVAVRETDGSPSIATATTIEFGPATTSSDEFIVTDEGSNVARIRLGNQVGLLNAANIVTGGWTFNTAATVFTTALSADGGINTSATNQNLVLSANGSGQLIANVDENSFVGIGTTTPRATLDVRGQVGTDPAASVSARTSFAALLVDNSGIGDLFTASKAGVATFTVNNTGQILSSNYRVDGGVLYADATGKFLQTTEGNLGECLQSAGGGTPTWGECGSGGGGSSAWDVAEGAISPKFASTVDLLLGGTSTASAKFAVLGINSGTPTASISAPATGNALSLTADGTISTTQGQTLTLGGGDSGEVRVGSLLRLDATLGIRGGGLSDCDNPSTAKLLWDAATNRFACGTDQGGGGGSSMTVRESDSSPAVSAVALLEFGPGSVSSDEFIVTDEGSTTARVRIGNQVGILNQAETVTGGWTFDTSATTFTTAMNVNGGISTATDTNLTLGASGIAHIILSTDSDTGVFIGSAANTLAPLSVSGGIGNNAAFIVNQQNDGDLLAASASGVTKFVVKADGTASTSAGLTIDTIGNIQTTRGQTLTIGGNTTGEIVLKPNQTNNSLTLSDNGSVLSLLTNSTTGLTIDTATTGNIAIGTGSNGKAVTLGSTTNGSSVTINSGTGGLNLGDSATTKAIEIGGVDTNGADTIRISTNATSADSINIGNANAGTTMSLTGGDDWSITTAGAFTGGAASFTTGAFSDQISASNEGIEFVESDTNPTCASGNYTIYADTSDGKLKKCQNGTVSDLASSSTSQFIVKGTNENVASGTTLQSDDELTFAVGSGETWVFDFVLRVTNVNSATPDWKAAILGASGWTCSITMSGTEPLGAAFPQATGTDCDNAPTALVNATIVADVNIPFQVNIRGQVTTNSAGSITLQWAPNTSGSLTVLAGSYVLAQKVGGADLAEAYYAHEAISAGTVVSLDSTLTNGVKKSEKAYEGSILGIVSTKPGLLLADSQGITEGVPVFVALAGRVPVYVSTENGAILPGDLLTSSSIPGVAMKATKPGFVIGQAMTSFGSAQDKGYSGSEIGSVMVFVKNQWYDPDTTVLALNDFRLSQKSATTSAGFDLTNSLGEAVTRVGVFAEAAIGNIQVGYAEAERLSVATYLHVEDTIATGMLEAKDVTTTSLIVTTDNISIGGLTLRDYIADVVYEVMDANKVPEGLVATTQNVSGLLTQESGEELFRQLLEENVLGASMSAAIAEESTSSESAEVHDINITNALTSLDVEGLATISSTLRVKENGLIEGILTVVDTLMTKNLVVSGLATFFDEVVFKGDVLFARTPTFNKDTAGFAVIKKGSDRVDVSFEKAYKEVPVVNATVSLESRITNQESREEVLRQEEIEQQILGSDTKFIITKRTPKGFTILLNQSAEEDVTFSWTALAVADVQTFESRDLTQFIPTPTVFMSSPSQAGVLDHNEGDPPSLEASEGRREVIRE